MESGIHQQLHCSVQNMSDVAECMRTVKFGEGCHDTICPYFLLDYLATHPSDLRTDKAVWLDSLCCLASPDIHNTPHVAAYCAHSNHDHTTYARLISTVPREYIESFRPRPDKTPPILLCSTYQEYNKFRSMMPTMPCPLR